MRSEREKMLAGELYDRMNPKLAAMPARARELDQALGRVVNPISRRGPR